MIQRGLLALGLMMAGACLTPAPVPAQSFPAGYYKHAKTCAQVQQSVFGPHWSSILLAQIEQESAWRPKVCSRYACGLTQFTGPTRRAVERQYGLSGDLWKPKYACLLQSYLMRDLARAHAPLFSDPVEQWAVTLRVYNGSPASFMCEYRRCGEPSSVWTVARCRCRAPAFHHENTEYPRRILFRLWPKYREAWGR